MLFNQNEINEWEQNLEQLKFKYHYGHIKYYKNPWKEKLKDFRNNKSLPDGYDKEPKWVRRKLNRKYRHIAKRLVNEERYDDIAIQKKSRGWETY